MKKRLSHEFGAHQAEDANLFGTYPKACGSKKFSPVRRSKLFGSKNGNEGPNISRFLFICIIFLRLRNADLGCKYFTLFSSRMRMLPKRLRASA